MGEIKSYRDLEVWRLGIELAMDCYALTKRFPADERFGLISQTRRAAVSIPQPPVTEVQQRLSESRQHSLGIQR
jgi:four helix bundle protein